MTIRPDADIKNNNADVYQIMRPHYYFKIIRDISEEKYRCVS